MKNFISCGESKNSHAKSQRRKEIVKKKLCVFFAALRFCVLLFLLVRSLFAQGYGGALTFQGIDHYSLHSGASRAMGGVTIGVNQDAGLMFQNPAALHSISGIQAALGGLWFSQDLEQEQNYAPVRYYPNLSLLLEGLTARIPNPDTMLVGFTAQDTVQRPYDSIGPNWSRSKNDNAPLQAFLAVPLSLGNIKFVAGIGAANYADLNHYYQNNNVLSPNILSQRPLPTLRPGDDNPLPVNWSQTMRSRAGTLQGYGIALAGSVMKNVSLGFSGMILDGSSDDVEQEVARGRLTFYSNAFRADSIYRRITKTGTSDFSGTEFTLSSTLTGRFVSVGFAVKPPATITRDYTMQVATDTTGTPSLSTIQGEDELQLPWRGRLGLALTPKENLTLGLEYEFRPYDSAKYVDANGVENSPWLSTSLFRIGAEYRIASWLALRGGMRGEAEVFEPEGNQIEGEPVTYTVYSAGVGITQADLRLSVTYENALLRYQDIWASAISKNRERRHTFIAQLSYAISFSKLE